MHTTAEDAATIAGAGVLPKTHSAPPPGEPFAEDRNLYASRGGPGGGGDAREEEGAEHVHGHVARRVGHGHDRVSNDELDIARPLHPPPDARREHAEDRVRSEHGRGSGNVCSPLSRDKGGATLL